MIVAKVTSTTTYGCFYSQASGGNTGGLCTGMNTNKLFTDVWAPGGIKTNSDEVQTGSWALYTYNTKGPWTGHKSTAVIRVNGEEKAWSAYGSDPAASGILAGKGRLGAWHNSRGDMNIELEIAEVCMAVCACGYGCDWLCC